jgi:phage repressor protein C with HTH and peptisase S24 domain
MTCAVEKIASGCIFPTVATFGENVKRLREAKPLKAKDLAQLLGVSPSVVSGWENDRSGLPETPTLLKIAKALNVSIDALLSGVDLEYDRLRHTSGSVLDDAEDFDRDITRGYKKHDVPVIGDAEASTNGIIAWSDEGIVKTQVEQWVSRAFSEGDPKAYALRVRGDSMVPRYFPGEIVIAQPRLSPKDGDFACVQLVNGERLIKRVFRSAGGWLLRSMNESYPTREVTNDEIHAIHVIKHSVARM